MTKCNSCNIGSVVDERCPRCGVEQPEPHVLPEEAPKPEPVKARKAAPPKPEKPKAKPVKKPGIVSRALRR